MKASKFTVGVLALGLSASIAAAYPISLTAFATDGLWTDSFGSTLLPAGANFQLLWTPSTDANIGVGSTISQSDAILTSGLTSFNDYVIYSGFTDIDGGWAVPEATGTLSDGSVGGNTISSGYVYGIVYIDSSPGVGDAFAVSPLYGPPNPTWGNPSDQFPPPPDLIDFSPVGGARILDGSFVVVPEPATMALFGIGALTLAIRRRRK